MCDLVASGALVCYLCSVAKGHCTHARTYTRTHTHKRTHTQTHTNTHKRTHMCTNTISYGTLPACISRKHPNWEHFQKRELYNNRTHLHTHAHIRTHAHAHTHAHTHTHTHTPARINMHTPARINTHTHAHTHTHTHIDTCSQTMFILKPRHVAHSERIGLAKSAQMHIYINTEYIQHS